MPLDDILLGIIFGENLQKKLKEFKDTQQNPRAVLGASASREEVEAHINSLTEDIKRRIEKYTPPAGRDALINNVLRGDQRAIGIATTFEEAYVKGNVRSGNFEEYSMPVFEKLVSELKLDEEVSDELKDYYNYRNLEEPERGIINSAFTEGKSLIKLVITYLKLSENPQEVLGTSANQEKIEQKKTELEENIKTILKVYLKGADDIVIDYITTHLKDEGTLHYLAAVEKDVLSATAKTMPDEVKKEIGYNFALNSLKAQGYIN